MNKAKEKYALSIHTACQLFRISRRVYYYQSVVDDDDDIKEKLLNLAHHYPRYGYWKLYHLMRNQGYCINHKRVYRLYKALNLVMRRKTKKRLPVVEAKVITIPCKANHTWSIDFMADTLMSSKRFRTFNVIDDFNREGLAIEAAASIPSLRLTRILDGIAARRGYPHYIRCDNGPELRSQAFAAWAKQHHVELLFIQPGKPTQNALVERFNGTYRREILNAFLFKTIQEVQKLTDSWLREYNEIRPHAALGNISPIDFARRAKGGNYF